MKQNPNNSRFKRRKAKQIVQTPPSSRLLDRPQPNGSTPSVKELSHVSIASTKELKPRFNKLPPPGYGNSEIYKAYTNNRVNGKLFAPPDKPLTQSVVDVNVIVNICVPVWNRAKHIKELLDNIQDVVISTNETKIKVWIADFKSSDINLTEYVQSKQFNFPIEIVSLDPPFIIAKGLQIAADNMSLGEIVYFIDADAHLPHCIFNRVRTYTIKNKQFYCPIVSIGQENNKLYLPPPGKDHGGKGHVGVFIDDFRRCNGWRDPEHYVGIPIKGPGPMDRTEWGGHDGHIYNKLRWDHLNVYRPRETDQWVKYHNRENTWYPPKRLKN